MQTGKKKMQAVEITTPGGPDVLQLALRDIPKPNDDEVLIKVRAAGVNRPDCVQRKGLYPAPAGASDIPGLEVAGDIIAVGDIVADHQVGDKVCALIAGGGYAEYATAHTGSVLPIPAGLSYTEAASLPETFFTVWSNVFERAYLDQGETLLVHGGSSGIGSTAIQLANVFGVSVITTVGSQEKADFCKNIGADLTVNYREEDFVAAVDKFTNGAGVNVVLDMVGGDYIPRNIQCMAMDGRHVSIAFLHGPVVTDFNMLPIMLKRLTFTGSTLRARSTTFKAAVAAELHRHVWPLISDGRVRPLLHQTYSLSEAAKAHTDMEASHHMGKLVLNLDQ